MKTDYTGKTNDLLIMHIVNRSNVVFQFGDESKIITGISKLTQMFVKELLTVQGEIKGNPDAGCNFLEDVRTGKIQTEQDVQAYFGLAADTIISRFELTQPEDTPDDERLTQVILNNFAMETGKLTLNVTLETAAGVSRDIYLPLTIAV